MRHLPPHRRAACEALEQRRLLSSVRFAVIGDYGNDNPAEADVATELKSWRPDFVITTGDNNYPIGEASTIDVNIGRHYAEFIGSYTGAYGPGSAVNRFFPSLGNHDWYTPVNGLPKGYLDYFALPGNERYYDFVRAPVHFFALDSDPSEPDGVSPTSVQGQWLQQRLAASTSPWKVVYFHHPPYSSASHGPQAWMQWPFAAWGADVVLAGHEHVYERMVNPADGLTYVTNGLGGTPNRYDFLHPIAAGSEVRYNADHGAMIVNATDAQMTMQFITRAGELIDSWSLNASATPPASPTGLTASVVSARQVDLSWTDASGDEGGFRLERAVGGGPFEVIATLGPGVTRYSDVALAGGTTYHYRVRAFNTAGASPAYANAAPATTPAGAIAPLPAPATFGATSPSPTRVDLVWGAVAGAAGYKVEYSADGIVYAPLMTAPAGTTGLPVNGLAAGTLHYFRVRAYDAAGDSRYADATQATAVIPIAAPDLAAASDSGISDADDVTNVATPTFTGAAPAGTIVRLFSDGVEVGSAVAGAGGAYAVTAGPLAEGERAITVRFEGTGGGLSAPSEPLRVTLDRTAPKVVQVRYNGALAATANVRQVVVSFSEAVNAGVANLGLRNDSTGKVQLAGETAFSYVGGPGHAGTWSFPLRRFGLLENGNYTATIHAATADLAGNLLDGDGNGQGGDARAFTFYQLAGDANGDRTVNALDMKALVTGYNALGASLPADFSGNGRVSFEDFQILELNFGRSVPAPAPAVEGPVAASVRAVARPPTTVQAVRHPVFSKKRVGRPAADVLA